MASVCLSVETLALEQLETVGSESARSSIVVELFLFVLASFDPLEIGLGVSLCSLGFVGSGSVDAVDSVIGFVPSFLVGSSLLKNGSSGAQ